MNVRPKILITGGNGQLGQCFATLNQNDFELIILGRTELDICNKEQINTVFNKHQPDFCIHGGAYTKVDVAEDEQELAYEVNEIGSKSIALACSEFNTHLVYISSDFIFDGTKETPYSENEKTNPLSVYGASKLAGEIAVQNNCSKHTIIRTSWVFSEFGHNFVKTMIRLGNKLDKLTIVNDQIGQPTYAKHLAEKIIELLAKKELPNVLNLSNIGAVSWFDFAQEIFKLERIKVDVSPISSEEFGAKAIRPKYSVLSNELAQNQFNIKMSSWQEALKECLEAINKNNG